MKTVNGIVFLEERAGGASVLNSGVEYTDASNTRVHIPAKVLVGLYELMKYDIERRDVNFDAYADSLFEE